MSEQLLSAIDLLLQTTLPIPGEQSQQIRTVNHDLKAAMREYRKRVVDETAQGTIKTSEVLPRMDTARTLRRIGYHLWRITNHLTDSPPNSPAAGPEST